MEHHSADHGSPKKIHFGASIIMGLSFWVVAFFFLSMCDGPKACCAEGEGECCKMEQGECKKAEGENKEAEEVKAVVVDSVANAFSEAPDTMKVDTEKKEEPAKEEKGEKK